MYYVLPFNFRPKVIDKSDPKVEFEEFEPEEDPEVKKNPSIKNFFVQAGTSDKKENRSGAGLPDGVFSYQKCQLCSVNFGGPWNGKYWYIL
jgi:hypothetical protein